MVMVTLRVSNQGGDPVTEPQLTRMAKRRLAILRHAEEITGNLSLTCRYYGSSRPCCSSWRRRYHAHGLDGLGDRSHRPQVSPNATRTEVVGKIIDLGQHDHVGPARIARYLARYHDLQLSPSGGWRILKRLGLNRLPASQRHQRHDRRWPRDEQPLPGHRVQLDVKFIQPLPGTPKARKYDQVPAIDDGTRLRVLRISPSSTSTPPSSSPTRCWRGCRSGSRSSRPTTVSSSAPASPGMCWTRASAMSTSSPARRGATARSSAPTASMPRSPTGCSRGADRRHPGFNDKLQEWEDFSNYHRPHSGLGGQTPYEQPKQRTQTRV
jgi:transposase